MRNGLVCLFCFILFTKCLSSREKKESQKKGVKIKKGTMTKGSRGEKIEKKNSFLLFVSFKSPPSATRAPRASRSRPRSTKSSWTPWPCSGSRRGKGTRHGASSCRRRTSRCEAGADFFFFNKKNVSEKKKSFEKKAKSFFLYLFFENEKKKKERFLSIVPGARRCKSRLRRSPSSPLRLPRHGRRRRQRRADDEEQGSFC